MTKSSYTSLTESSLELQTAVWVYDIEENLILWANAAALKWWQTDSVESLNKRDFASNTSDAVKQNLLNYQKRFYSGESFNELWQFSPKGEQKQAFCQFSGQAIVLDDGTQKMAMLVEATPTDIITPIIKADATAIVATFDENGILQSCNPPFQQQFNVPDIITNLQIHNLFVEPNLFEGILIQLKRNQHVEQDILLTTKSGDQWFQASISMPIQDAGDRCILLRLHNINTRKNKELKLLQQSQTDMLTGLLNRRGLNLQMQSLTRQQTPFHLFYIDLDGFKMINDSLGHSAGDLVLTEVSSRLQALPLENCQVCRFGGDEFVFIAVGRHSKEQVIDLANAMVTSLSAPYSHKQSNLLIVSASVGYATFPEDSDSPDDIVRYADAAMYYSKKLGKKRWTQFTHGMDKALLRKSVVAQHLSVAIEKNELSLYYQPIMNVNDNSIHSFEALLRWSNPDLGNVGPEELIAVAEDIGLISQVENWVIKTALADLYELRQRTNSDASIAINISALHIVDSALPDFLQQQIAKNSLLPSDVIIEITESVLLEELNEKNNAIDKITQSGIQISIDDFGTGYSSLAYLHSINATIVKIDKTFLSAQSRSKNTLKAIENLINSIGMLALVEGVETQEQAQLCKNIGISLHQGYFYARPKPLGLY